MLRSSNLPEAVQTESSCWFVFSWEWVNGGVGQRFPVPGQLRIRILGNPTNNADLIGRRLAAVSRTKSILQTPARKSRNDLRSKLLMCCHFKTKHFLACPVDLGPRGNASTVISNVVGNYPLEMPSFWSACGASAHISIFCCFCLAWPWPWLIGQPVG